MIMDSLSYAFGALQRYLVPLIAPLLAFAVAVVVMNVVLGIIPILGHLLLAVAMPALGVLFQVVYLPMVLRAHDGQPVDPGQMAKLPDNLVDLAVVVLGLGAAVSIGSAFFLVPGLVAMAMLGFAPYLVIERRLGYMDAFRQSIRIGEQNLVQLAIAALVIQLVAAAGSILFGIGLLFTIPLGMLAWTHVYRLNVPMEEARPRRRGTGRVPGTGPVQE